MIKKLSCSLLLITVLLTGCQRATLKDSRDVFKTVVRQQNILKEPIKIAPTKIFRNITYPSTSGELAAYLSPNPGNGKKHPAIIWITGGDCNSIGDSWSPQPRNNDQSASAFRQAGIIMMFPSLRGGNNNPGNKEGFYGEVNDILAAVKYLEKQDYVDPKRIYLGGHSTGGTLALLVAEYSDRFRGVFSFGPVANVATYGQDSGFLPFDLSNQQEVKLRSPIHWLFSINSPTWVFEGTNKGNIADLRSMAKETYSARVNFVEVKNTDHFGILAPTNEIIAKKIRQDTTEESNISLTEAEVNKAFLP
jgi:dipeptidyl aminopeptidase/acylaminoacyl peptidase